MTFSVNIPNLKEHLEFVENENSLAQQVANEFYDRSKYSLMESERFMYQKLYDSTQELLESIKFRIVIIEEIISEFQMIIEKNNMETDDLRKIINKLEIR